MSAAGSTTPGDSLLEFVDSLDALTAGYAALFCDVWGVVHNGVAANLDACAALERARVQGLAVILLTNSPRPRDGVIEQLASLGVPPASWDRVVTSGDVTRDLIQQGARLIHHIGPERDFPIFAGLDVELVGEQEALTVVCTGLVNDEEETPEDYIGLLARLRSRDLPFICANPDLVAERGEKMVWCAGALARDYALMGGRTLISGKPFRPIYEVALAAACEVAGREVLRKDALAIGDGMPTDIKGATDNGIDALYISGGIHAKDYGDTADEPHAGRLADFLAHHRQTPVAVMSRLR